MKVASYKTFNKKFFLNSVMNDFELVIFLNKLKLTTKTRRSREMRRKETNGLDKIQCKSRTERHKTCLKGKNT